VPEVVVELPKRLRSELKEPLGPIFTDADELLAEASPPLVAVGDVVTYHLIEAGYTPTVALVDERTERDAVDEEVARTIETFDGFDRRVTVENPPATLTAELLSALTRAVRELETTATLLQVDGEEDLATLPAILVAPEGASIVYGQPGEGMVHAVVDHQQQEFVRDLLARMDGNLDRFGTLLD